MAVAGCVSLCMSSWAHSPTLKRSDQQTAALGCQHSTLISLWWIEWKTCLILFLYQHRSICASTEINTGLHFYTLLDLDTRSVLTRKALHSTTPQTSCHYRICQSLCFERGLPCKLYFCAICGHVKINCLLFLSSFFVGIGLSYVCVGLQMFRCDIQAGGRWWDTLPYCCVGV